MKKPVCFFTTYDARAREMAQGMVNSVKRWYPNISMEALEIDIQNKDAEFDLRNFCEAYLKRGLELLGEYKRIIYIDPDSVMCNKCPDLFDDFELGCVQNNTNCGPEYGGTNTDVYVNAGLSVCTNKEVWKERIDEFHKRNDSRWECLNEQNALNHVYHNTKHKVKLLEFPEKSYGITSLAYYQDITIKDGELCLSNNKKLCIFHAAGVYWKTGTKINFDYIKDEPARNLIVSYTNA